MSCYLMYIELSENMFDDGFSDCTSIDYSEVVIEKMQSQFRATKPNLKCMTHLDTTDNLS
jgi:hypothetical protein